MEIDKAQYQVVRAEQLVQAGLLMALATNNDDICGAFIRQLTETSEKLVANLLASGTTTDASIDAVIAAQGRWLSTLRQVRATPAML
jgi:hypothetical protein